MNDFIDVPENKKKKPVYSLNMREKVSMTTDYYEKLLGQYEKKVGKIKKLKEYEFFEKAHNYVIALLHVNKMLTFMWANSFWAKTVAEKHEMDVVIKRSTNILNDIFTKAEKRNKAGWERMLNPILYQIDYENPDKETKIF